MHARKIIPFRTPWYWRQYWLVRKLTSLLVLAVLFGLKLHNGDESFLPRFSQHTSESRRPVLRCADDQFQDQKPVTCDAAAV